MATVVTRACRFLTDRLDVSEWHRCALPHGLALVDVVSGLLTAATTQSLPSGWQGEYDLARATVWIRDRDAESPTLMAVDRATGAPVGLLILFEMPAEEGSDLVDVRLGYFLAESVWGRGLGTELVAGFVDWCRSEPRIRSIAGGVEADNAASARVLTKNGFTTAGPVSDIDDEQIYELVLISGQD